ncbi:hypothetical protein [Burkholderia sp. BCC1988]|uniref:hypothetical protein n=1 Tax=Burkholderia sp. BCC1988 TaxID=2817443 RepID=UPI002AAFD06B|nr:hypothetical protein [Burkholderia sp. BCC1988]
MDRLSSVFVSNANHEEIAINARNSVRVTPERGGRRNYPDRRRRVGNERFE